MSTGEKVPLADALAIALAFRDLFDGCYERWEIAGSIRRKRPEVGDVEHVVIPRIGECTGEGMFPEPGSLLWQRAELLIGDKTLSKALYGQTQTTRWGDKYRGCVFRGVKHEIFTADADNWGCILAIRTGPAEFSERIVTRLKNGGRLRQIGGYLHYPNGARYSCGDEREYLRLCGEKWVEPENRA